MDEIPVQTRSTLKYDLSRNRSTTRALSVLSGMMIPTFPVTVLLLVR